MALRCRVLPLQRVLGFYDPRLRSYWNGYRASHDLTNVLANKKNYHSWVDNGLLPKPRIQSPESLSSLLLPPAPSCPTSCISETGG